MVRTSWSVTPGLPPLAVPVRSHPPTFVSGVDIPSYRNLQTRKEMRERAWQVDGWADTVHKARPGFLIHYRPPNLHDP